MNETVRVLICGDRNYTNEALIEAFVQTLPKDAVIIEGEARGADSMARDAGEKHGYQVMKFPADWNKHGRAAGPIRNKQMLVEGKPNLVIAYHDDIEKSKGTMNMIKQSRKAGLQTYLNAKDYTDIILGIIKEYDPNCKEQGFDV